MDIKYSKTKEVPVAEIIREEFSLVSTKPAGEYDRTFTDIELFAGEEYTVECGGTEYSCTAWEEDGKIHIGGKTEPFDIYRWESDIWAKGEGEIKVTRETIVQDERVSGAPDWNTLKNRPFYEETKLVMTTVFEDNFGCYDKNGQVSFDTSPLKDLSYGDLCNITFENEIFENVVVENYNNEKKVTFSDYEIRHNPTDDSCIMYGLEEFYNKLLYVKIETMKPKTTITPIDIKYLPEGFPKKGTTLVEIVSKQTMEYNGDGISVAELQSCNFGIEFIFVINGVEQKCTCDTYEIFPGEIYAPAFYGEGFTIEAGTLRFTENGTYTFAVYKEDTVITPIDIEYLPIDELKTALGLA